MPKRKRTKTAYAQRKEKGKELSEAEIWDDSFLIRSWEDAVAEYEYYHSLAKRGVDGDVDVEGVLDEAEEREGRGKEVDLGLSSERNVVEGRDGRKERRGARRVAAVGRGDRSDVGMVDGGEEGKIDEDIEDGEIEDGEVDVTQAEDFRNPTLANGITPGNVVHGKQHGPQLPPSNLEQQQPASGDVGKAQASVGAGVGVDQTLENVKMAYYWAGYYSGLYDGQRQAAGAEGTNTKNAG